MSSNTAQLQKYQTYRKGCLQRLEADHPEYSQLCRNVAWNCSEWYRNGSYVRSRRDANRLRKGIYGYEMPLGENRFIVDEAIQWAYFLFGRIMFKENQVRDFIVTTDERRRIRIMLVKCVAGNGDAKFDSYPVEDGRMAFGTHFVNLDYTTNAIIHFSGFNKNEK